MMGESLLNFVLFFLYLLLADSFLRSDRNSRHRRDTLDAFYIVVLDVETLQICVCLKRTGEALVADPALGIVISARVHDGKFLLSAAERTIHFSFGFTFVRTSHKKAYIRITDFLDFKIAVFVHEKRLLSAAYLINSAFEWMSSRA